jgi:hypothetical protein
MRIVTALPFILGIAVAVPAIPAQAQIAVGISVRIAPPLLPVYVQPAIPAPGYLWTPGYWAWDGNDYYWVPGTWVEPPSVGLLWTPAWWGWNDGVYAFHRGYWGPHVGFYGGLNIGFGYTGSGFFGGRWEGGRFAYNSAVNNFGGVHVTNVYNEHVDARTESRASFNGGPGGVEARPTAAEEAASHEEHRQPTAAQEQHEHAAAANPALRSSVNHGVPAIAATARPGDFHSGAVPARAAGEPNGAAHAAEHGPATPRPANAAHSAARPAGAAHPAQAARPAAAPRPAAHPAAPRPAAHPAARPAAPKPAPHPAAPHPAPAAHEGGGEKEHR